MIEYYSSKLNPDCYWAALDGVLVAFWHNRWIDQGIYRPIRSHYYKIEWNKTPYDPNFLFNSNQWEIVKITGLESHMDDQIPE